ncbi:MAG: cytochrome c3 family protein [bacterium]
MIKRPTQKEGISPSFMVLILFLCSLIFSSCVLLQRKRTRFASSRCVECHTQKAQDYLQKLTVHKPVSEKDCSRCHEPHGFVGTLHLWEQGKPELCFRCHPKIQAQVSQSKTPKQDAAQGGAFSVHKPVEKCTVCHDPHSSDNANLTRQRGQELCFSCHDPAQDQEPFNRPFKHKALEKGCQLCHLPHASDKPELLADEEKRLCLTCHRTTDDRLVAAHQGYPVKEKRCSQCHNPHSSDTQSLLRARIHKPMQEKKCSFCHLSKDANEPFRLKKEKTGELCYQCHDGEKYRTAIGQDAHKAVQEGRCLACHAPHASDSKGLLSYREPWVCYQCHLQVLKETEQRSVHKPMKNGQCTVCHDPHSAQVKWPLRGGQAGLCYQCHKEGMSEEGKYPEGDHKDLDPDSQAGEASQPGSYSIHSPVQKGECLSCHANHASTVSGLLKEPIPKVCYQCHMKEEKQYTRVNAHTPVQNGNCLGCHTAHEGDHEKLLLFPAQELCWTCHLPLQKQLEDASLHSPFKNGQCMECHNPHASDCKNMLIQNSGLLCLSGECHQPLGRDLAAGGKSPASVTHSPVRSFQCLSCHHPHGSRLSRLLLSQSGSLCFPCHKSMEEKIGQANAHVHTPVQKGKCLTCHSGHGASHPSVLAAGVDSMCLECHKQDEKLFLRAHGNIRPDKNHCLDCHDPHSSKEGGLFRRVVHEPFQSKKCDICHRRTKDNVPE